MPRNNYLSSDEKESNHNASRMDQENIHHSHQGKSLFWVVLIVIIIAAIWGLDRFGWLPGSNRFQAVFLNNGQVYFGKLSNQYGGFLSLKDIYYLQITQPIQPGEANSASNINLVKLGNELHGPTDEMKINRQAVLFIENLKADSKVVEAIKQLEKGS